MIDHQKILILRQEIRAFLKSNEKQFSFVVDCELKDRINFIYQVILPKERKYLFYLRFFFSRIAYYVDYSPFKVFIYRLIGIKIGKGVFISPDVYIDVHFPTLIKIENYAILGHGTSFFCHDFINNTYRLGRIKIGEGAVIGAYSAIGCAVFIGKEANVRARSTILKDVSDFHKFKNTVDND